MTPIGERETILIRYLPLVRLVARRFLLRKRPSVTYDDLLAWGAFGLFDALEHYDPTREVVFPTYARFRIRGAILDQLRELDWTPRSVREKAAAVERVSDALQTRLGRAASEEEMASALGLSLADYRALLGEIAPISLVSLEDVGDGARDGELPLDGAQSDPLRSLLWQERVRLVTDAIARLSERDQLLLSLYYRDELTMKEVGAVLGLTESRVSQLHARALLRMRAHLQGSREPLAEAG